MSHYLIQFRFRGKYQKRLRELIVNFNSRLGINDSKAVPHVTLAGPFKTYDENRLIQEFHYLCRNSEVMSFESKGFHTFQEKRVVYLSIYPNGTLVSFRKKLAQALQPFCQMSPWDLDEEFHFHSTITMNLDAFKFRIAEDVIREFENQIEIRNIVARITLLKNKIILREYDFFLHALLTRDEARSAKIYKATMLQLKNYLMNGRRIM